MEGFFSKNELESYAEAALMTSGTSCSRCGLLHHCKSPKLKVRGKGSKKVLFVTEQPSELDDVRNMWFTDEASRHIVNLWGADEFFDECWVTGSIQCYRKGQPTKNQIGYCRTNLLRTIDKLQPHVIVLLGDESIRSFIGKRWKKGLVTKSEAGEKVKKTISTRWRGFAIPDQDYKAWVIPTYDPLYVQDSRSTRLSAILADDLELAYNHIHTPVPDYINSLELDLLINDRSIVSYLLQVEKQAKRIVFDYETNALKPYNKYCDIYYLSVSHRPGQAAAFPLTERAIPIWIRILENSNIKKIAHNMKFEHVWSKVVLGANINNWELCTLTSTHFLDNRAGITGLKFQTYVNFGIIDYASDMEEYLTSVPGTKYNRISQAPMKKILKYSAMDSALTHKLFAMQMEDVDA